MYCVKLLVGKLGVIMVYDLTKEETLHLHRNVGPGRFHLNTPYFDAFSLF